LLRVLSSRRNPTDWVTYPGVTNPRDIGSFATTSRSAVNTLMVVLNQQEKRKERGERKKIRLEIKWRYHY